MAGRVRQASKARELSRRVPELPGQPVAEGEAKILRDGTLRAQCERKSHFGERGLSPRVERVGTISFARCNLPLRILSELDISQQTAGTECARPASPSS